MEKQVTPDLDHIRQAVATLSNLGYHDVAVEADTALATLLAHIESLERERDRALRIANEWQVRWRDNLACYQTLEADRDRLQQRVTALVGVLAHAIAYAKDCEVGWDKLEDYKPPTWLSEARRLLDAARQAMEGEG